MEVLFSTFSISFFASGKKTGFASKKTKKFFIFFTKGIAFFVNMYYNSSKVG